MTKLDHHPGWRLILPVNQAAPGNYFIKKQIFHHAAGAATVPAEMSSFLAPSLCARVLLHVCLVCAGGCAGCVCVGVCAGCVCVCVCVCECMLG